MYQSNQFDIRVYLQYIENVFAQAINVLLDVSNLPYNLRQPIYSILVGRGFDLVINSITKEFTNRPWNEQEAKNLICTNIEYIIYNEALKYNYNLSQFVDSYNWVLANSNQQVNNYSPQQQFNYNNQNPYNYQRSNQITPLRTNHSFHELNPSMETSPRTSIFDEIGTKNNMNIQDHLLTKNVPNPNTDAFKYDSNRVIELPKETIVKPIEKPIDLIKIPIENSSIIIHKDEDVIEDFYFDYNDNKTCIIAKHANIVLCPIEIMQVEDEDVILELVNSIIYCNSINDICEILKEPVLNDLLIWLVNYVNIHVANYIELNYSIKIPELPLLTSLTKCLDYLASLNINTTNIKEIIITKIFELLSLNFEIGKIKYNETDKATNEVINYVDNKNSYILMFTTQVFIVTLPVEVTYNHKTNSFIIREKTLYDIDGLIENVFKITSNKEFIFITKLLTKYKIERYSNVVSPSLYKITPIL